MARHEEKDERAVQQPTAERPGAPIPPPLRHQLEVTFRADLSNVRIHSAHNPSALGATAFTRGDDIHFQPGFNPYTRNNHELLAHELTHVIQQRGVGQLPAVQRTFKKNPQGG